MKIEELRERGRERRKKYAERKRSRYWLARRLGFTWSESHILSSHSESGIRRLALEQFKKQLKILEGK